MPTCAQQCDNSQVQVIFSKNTGQDYVFNFFHTDGAFISFDEDVTNITTKRDSKGNVRATGDNYVVRNTTITIPCSDEVIAFEQDWKNPIDMCGDLAVVSGCCQDYRFEAVRVTSVQAASFSNEVESYNISFEGVLV